MILFIGIDLIHTWLWLRLRAHFRARTHKHTHTPHARHDYDLFATYVAYIYSGGLTKWNSERLNVAFCINENVLEFNICATVDKNTAAYSQHTPTQCTTSNLTKPSSSKALATLFIKCKLHLYTWKFNSLCGFELLLMIWFTFQWWNPFCVYLWLSWSSGTCGVIIQFDPLAILNESMCVCIVFIFVQNQNIKYQMLANGQIYHYVYLEFCSRINYKINSNM